MGSKIPEAAAPRVIFMQCVCIVSVTFCAIFLQNRNDYIIIAALSQIAISGKKKIIIIKTPPLYTTTTVGTSVVGR